MSALPGTIEELDKIQSLADGVRITRLEGSKATYASVLDGMHDHSWVHLACHASQDLNDPTSSAFYLYDKPLDMAAICQYPFKSAGLAFLSACQTATGVEELSEEALHLAAGMLMSGYPSVIATMWSVRDQDAPIIAEKVYARLIDGGSPSTQHAARALHDAVAFLREMVGEDNVEAWAPYIHIGL
ncbi:CHAT domain protein [Ceratobasidium sp. AG-Ba]|nr:CHAT domain protein [Ceratobasidium sp. AG-Ba]